MRLDQQPPSDEVDAVLAQVASRLRSRGERMTAPRRAVIRALVERGGHLGAEAVLDVVAGIDPRVHRASVYRALSALTQADILHHVHEGHGSTVYHLRADAHLHAQCQHCGRLLDVRPDLLDEVATALDREHGFTLHPEHVALSGHCADCLTQASVTRGEGDAGGGQSL